MFFRVTLPLIRSALMVAVIFRGLRPRLPRALLFRGTAGDRPVKPDDDDLHGSYAASRSRYCCTKSQSTSAA